MKKKRLKIKIVAAFLLMIIILLTGGRKKMFLEKIDISSFLFYGIINRGVLQLESVFKIRDSSFDRRENRLNL